MGLFDRNTQQDTSTREDRKAWKQRAEQQIAEQNGQQQPEQDTEQASGHRRARRPQ